MTKSAKTLLARLTAGPVDHPIAAKWRELLGNDGKLRVERVSSGLSRETLLTPVVRGKPVDEPTLWTRALDDRLRQDGIAAVDREQESQRLAQLLRDEFSPILAIHWGPAFDAGLKAALADFASDFPCAAAAIANVPAPKPAKLASTAVELALGKALAATSKLAKEPDAKLVDRALVLVLTERYPAVRAAQRDASNGTYQVTRQIRDVAPSPLRRTAPGKAAPKAAPRMAPAAAAKATTYIVIEAPPRVAAENTATYKVAGKKAPPPAKGPR